MKLTIFLVATMFSLTAFGQYYFGQGYFPIDTVFTVVPNDSDFIKIPENSIWRKSYYGKEGLINQDTSMVLVTDTNNVNVKQGSYYFDLEVPNEMILGGSDRWPLQYVKENNEANGFENIFWNYDIIIEHKHNITDDSHGLILFKEFVSVPFDTIGKRSEDGFDHSPFFGIINSSSNLYWDYLFEYPENYIISGVRNKDSFYSWIYYFILPVSSKSIAIENKDYKGDTTTIRIVYNSPDSLSGGPGWMIKSIALRTYMCTANCPTDIIGYENSDVKLEIYPNPVTDKFYIDTHGQLSRHTRFEILNSLGQSIPVALEIYEEVLVFDTSHLKNGAYFLIVNDKDKKQSIQFMKMGE